MSSPLQFHHNTLQKGNVFALPALHYKMEFAAQVLLAYQQIKPDCVAVELPETMSLQLLHAASRLPDISVVIATSGGEKDLYYLAEPCDPSFEALRLALEDQVPAYCIDRDVDAYPEIREKFPDPYSLTRIGLQEYYNVYVKSSYAKSRLRTESDVTREMYMAKRLKELSFSFDRILFVGGMSHIEHIFHYLDNTSYPAFSPAERKQLTLATLSESSCRDCMAEYGWISAKYEEERRPLGRKENPVPDRQKLIYRLFREAAEKYKGKLSIDFPGYHLRNLMKFLRNYCFLYNQLMPDLFQILTAAKSCVDHNFAYEVWELATAYPHLKNVDNLPSLELSPEDVWGSTKWISFHLKEQRRKGFEFRTRKKDTSAFRFQPPGPFSICSYPPEDMVVEQFGEFLKKKGTQLAQEEGARTVPFSTSLEDGIDTRETIRHWAEKKLYVKVKGKPPGAVGSVVVVFDEDNEPETGKEQFPWKTTWLGEHSQESDMAFYATPLGKDVIGPGISRCRYGGFMMSSPPRRMFDVWQDPDYASCHTKAEVLLMAAIDYAVKPLVVYVSAAPPRSLIKSFAKRFGKKILYIPLGQLSRLSLESLRIFHVLDGHDKRDIADEYIPH